MSKNAQILGLTLDTIIGVAISNVQGAEGSSKWQLVST